MADVGRVLWTGRTAHWRASIALLATVPLWWCTYQLLMPSSDQDRRLVINGAIEDVEHVIHDVKAAFGYAADHAARRSYLTWKVQAVADLERDRVTAARAGR